MVRGTTTFAAVFDGPGGVVSGFVLAMPLLAGGATPAEDFAFNQRLASGAAARGLTLTSRQSPRHVRSHDGFDTAVSAVVDVGSAQGRLTGDTRALLLEIATGLAASDFTSIPAAGGAQLSAWVMNYQLLVRPAESRLYVIAAIVDRTRHDDPADTTSFLLADLSGGTALALKNARRYKGCDPFVTQDTAIADFIWMADISASTDDDRGRIVSAAEQVFDALANNGVDFRMGVVPHSQSTIHRPSDAGHMRGVGFTTDRTLFSAYLQDASGTDGCEFGIDSVDATIRRALPRTRGADPLKLREGAALAVMYISDENAQEIEEGPCWNIPQRSGCPTGIGDVYTGGLHTCAEAPDAAEQSCADMILAPYIQRIRDQGGTAFGQVFAASPLVQCNAGQLRCAGSAQDRNEPGRGYIEVINATGGLFYSPCDSNPGAGPLAAIVDAVTGAASEFQLRGAPIAATIQVGVTRVSGGLPAVTIVPRSKQDGFDYDPVSNSIFFRGQTHRPARGDRVTISYRVWLPPALPCGPCATNQVCDPMLGVCTCDAAVCSACGPNQACDASCNCACVPDCNGNCAPGRACNAATCQCECAPDCGGCPAGTACNPASCACECTGDCGGACAGTRLSCDAAACACECPADCGGRCGAGGVCNTSLCECACNPNCDDACTGRARCNPANACACECPADCSGCQDGTVCDAASCECVCPAGCDDQCPNERVCDPAHGCGCVCPPDCGGCANNEICDPNDCRCVPIV
jgi:hypothetical protein